MKYICIVGKKGVGKDTFANLLVQELSMFGTRANTYALATPIKENLINMFGCDRDIFYDPLAKEVPQKALYGVTPRVAMQKFGTEFAQGVFGKFIWCDMLIKHLESEKRYVDVAIITDVRFEHELEAFRKLDADVIFVNRDVTCFDKPEHRMGFKWLKKFYKKDTHISEAGLSHLKVSYDRVINNDAGLNELRNLAKEVAGEMECFDETIKSIKNRRKAAALEWLGHHGTKMNIDDEKSS
jgi:hypothetical protein